MQRAVNTLTDTIFPGVNVFKAPESAGLLARPNQGLAEEEQRQLQHEPRGKGYPVQIELVSNLPLQMALYFNVYYFPCWLIVSIVMLNLKFEHLHPLYRVTLVAILIVVTAVEVVRLYLGYLGNLSEMIPELAGFWLLTLLLQLPLQAFLLFNEDMILLPLERAANIIMMSFVVIELAVGYAAIRQVSKQLTTKFQLELLDLPIENYRSSSTS